MSKWQLLDTLTADGDSAEFAYIGDKLSFIIGDTQVTDDGFGQTTPGTITLLECADPNNGDWVDTGEVSASARTRANFSEALAPGFKYKFNLLGATGTIAGVPIWITQK